jgi:membrane peptidoglycan carboxypeptidase
LDKSLNSPYVQLGQDVGTDMVAEAAQKAGLVANANNGLLDYKTSVTYSIGTASPSAIRMADAYSTFDNNGEQNDPYSVVSVQYSGDQIYKHQPKVKVAFPAAVANTITGMLQDVVKKGTGETAQLPDGRVAAGKTGTTDDNKSAWFDGFTPQLSTSIVMFRRDDQVHTDKNGKTLTNPFLPMYGTGGAEKIHGNSFPASIWKDYMSTVLKDQPKLTFPKPTDVGGKIIYGNVPSPTPSPTATTPPPTTAAPTTTPASTPPTTPTATTSPTATATSSGSCMPWDAGYPDCGGSSPSPSDTPSETPTATATTPGRTGGLGG